MVHTLTQRLTRSLTPTQRNSVMESYITNDLLGCTAGDTYHVREDLERGRGREGEGGGGGQTRIKRGRGRGRKREHKKRKKREKERNKTHSIPAVQ